jgi:cytochrome c oxidase cbb3-type subunit 3
VIGFGGDGKAILTSILDGRQGAMPALATLSQKISSPRAPRLEPFGKPTGRWTQRQALFSNCVPCHGADGKGNLALGAPNLTDTVWLYGGDRADIAATIGQGRNGVMPAWRERLGEEDALLVAAWVYAQSHPATVAAR